MTAQTPRLTRPTILWFAICAGFSPTVLAADWKPEKAVEIVVNTPAGNGPDRTARVMQSIWQDKKQVEVPITVANKLGGGGVVAYTYLNSRAGDAHAIMIASKALLTNHIAGRGPSYTEFTPIAHLFAEYLVVTVKPDSPFKSGRDLIESVKKNPSGYSFGIATSLGNPNHQGVAVALKAGGLEIKSLKNVVFNAGSAALAALMGGHVDVVPVTAALGAQLAAQGQVRALAVSAPKRLGGALAEVPTWREQGYDAVVSQWRAVVGPRGMSEAQVAYWERAIRRMADTEEWRQDLAKNFWSAELMGAAEFRKFMDRDHAALGAFLGELGLAR